MKKTTFLLLFICSISYAQIKQVTLTKPELIGQIAPLGQVHIKCEKIENTIRFTFLDLNYSHLHVYKSFEFEDVDNAFKDLYQIIKNGLENKPDDDIVLELPESHIKLVFVSAMGVVNMRFSYMGDDGIGGFSAWLTKRKADKLFGVK